MSGKKRIVLVDDHPIVREGLRLIIDHEPDMTVCGEAGGAQEAISVIGGQKPDMAVIDISLVGTNGIELIKQVRAVHKSLPILVLSMHDEALYAERAILAGAKGYIRKQDGKENIRKAIRKVMNGGMYMSERFSETLLEKRFGGEAGKTSSPVDLLSDRELEVFQHIGRGMRPKEIAEAMGIGVRTVETYRAHIKEKLHLDSAGDLARAAIEFNRGTE